MADLIPSEINLDKQRASRTGLQEAIFCSGKSAAQLQSICKTVTEADEGMLFTRLDQSQFDALPAEYARLLDYDPVSRTATYQSRPLSKIARVAIITGGSSDVPVARETRRTLAYYGIQSLVIDDVGVAGLWRLLERVPDINALPVAIAIAGMDAALPTVLGGLVKCSIIAVPTSVGYGMARGGETALQSLLVSCAPGISVVNIDNGYGAACAAVRILNNIDGH